MNIVRLIYFSKASREMSLTDIQSILETSRSNNNKMGVCGMLCFDNNYFLQTLEGERSKVNELFLRIANDPRHAGVELISMKNIDKPKFKNWEMGYTGNSPSFEILLNKLGKKEFNPQELTAAQSLALLHELSINNSKN